MKKNTKAPKVKVKDLKTKKGGAVTGGGIKRAAKLE